LNIMYSFQYLLHIPCNLLNKLDIMSWIDIFQLSRKYTKYQHFSKSYNLLSIKHNLNCCYKIHLHSFRTKPSYLINCIYPCIFMGILCKLCH